MAQNPDGPKIKKPRLSQDPTELEKIKELWASGIQNQAEIARKINCPKATVAENIKKLKLNRSRDVCIAVITHRSKGS
ncbi:Uncharacterised protein [uncultured archaeon]|nr:Uncharacterised protein [uncultured archaeon]